MLDRVTRTLKFKVRSECHRSLNAAAIEVNQVFNYCNETSRLAATRMNRKRRWLSALDPCNLISGATRGAEVGGMSTGFAA